MIRKPKVLVPGVIAIGFLAVSTSHEVAFGQPGEASPVPLSFKSVYARRAVVAENVQWYDHESLVAEFRDSETGRTFVHRLALDGTVLQIIGEGELASASPDGRQLIMRANDEWLLHDRLTGKATSVSLDDSESPEFAAYHPPVWSRDSRNIAIVERPRAMDSASGETSKGPVVEVTRRTAIRRELRVTIVDSHDGTSVNSIYLEDPAGRARWSADGSLLVSQTAFSAADTRILRLEPGKVSARPIYRSRGRYQSLLPLSSPDGSLLALIFDVDNRTWEDFQSLLLVDPGTGEELRRITHDLPLLGRDYAWSPTGDTVFARVRNGGLDQIYAIPLSGEPRKLTSGLRRHFDMDLSPDGHRLSYQTLDGYGRRDIRVLDLNSYHESVVEVLDEPANQFQLGRWQHIRWSSSNGVRPFGHLFTPPDFRRDQRYPMIVDVHGGGPGSHLFLSSSLSGGLPLGPLVWHAWAAAGYVVFVPDYRSTGDYGPQVIAARYQVGEASAVKDIEDVDSGVRFLVDQGFIDPNRIAIYGHSAGGERVYLLLTKTNRYAAAVLHEATAPDPVSTFLTLASGKHTGGYPASVFRHYYGGSLAEVPNRYKANYMFDSHRNKTPTLIIVGNETLGGVHHLPNEVLHSILRQHGVPSRLLKFVTEGHNYSTPKVAKMALEEMNDWFRAYLTAPDKSITDSTSE